MPRNYRMEKAGQFGTELLSVAIGPIGPADYLGGATPMTANDTTIFALGGFGRRVRIAYMVTSATTIAIDADGTMLATCFKYNAVTNAQVAVTGAVSLEAAGLTAREGTVTQALATASDAALTLEAADTVEVSVVSNSAAIDTQPAGVWFRVYAYALE
jgi:hypothetical protein